jgi:hypothetical protein
VNEQRADEALFDEARLRRSLRLEAGELPPRLDVATIAARAEASSPVLTAASLASTFVAVAAGAILLGAGAMALLTVAPVFAAEALAAILATLARIAVPVSGLVDVARQPTLPIAALSALALAIAYEYAQRREPSHGLRTS